MSNSEKSAYITSISSFLPNEPVDNDHMEEMLGLATTKPSRARRIVLRNNGIKQRHYAIDPVTKEANYTNAQLAANAIKMLENDDFSIDQIDSLTASTTIPDQIMPNHGVMVHGLLKNPSCEVVSTSGVCLCGVTAMRNAYNGVLAGQYNKAVACASEAASFFLRGKNYEEETDARINALEENPIIAFEKDFLRWMLSDGAGAVLIEPEPKQEGISFRIDWMDILSYADEVDTCMYAGSEKQEDGSIKGWTQFSPKEVMEQAVLVPKQDVKLLNDKMPHYFEKFLARTMERHNLTGEEIDWYLPHVSSFYFWETMLGIFEKLDFKVPKEKCFTNLETKGNTGSASIYIMLDELYRTKDLQDGQKILLFIPESGRFSTGYVMLTVVKK
ncbi:MAG: StlD/DarB family beta-ketosynthase [Gammaproteobacteria bacterium]|nr:MAG: StlD/DarB family beta-ketosynthase [Gammaproteobacteria bacterium]